MCKTNNCTLYTWGTDSAVVGNLYQFTETIGAASIATSKDKTVNKKVCVDDDQIRLFKTARLFQVNNELEKYFFIGHKVPENGAKKSNRRYVFGLPFKN